MTKLAAELHVHESTHPYSEPSKQWVTSWQILHECDRRSGASLAEGLYAKYVPKSTDASVAVQVGACLRAVYKNRRELGAGQDAGDPGDDSGSE